MWNSRFLQFYHRLSDEKGSFPLIAKVMPAAVIAISIRKVKNLTGLNLLFFL